MTRRPIYDLVLIVLFVCVAAWLMHLTDSEPGLPKCRGSSVTHCQP